MNKILRVDNNFKKNCQVCEKVFFKMKKISKTQWKNKNSCSLKCSRKLMNLDPDRTLKERLMSKVHVPEDPTKCWVWLGSKVNGYGTISLNRKAARAHRVSWEVHKGIIPDGLLLRHLCNNPACVNPDHLKLGTHKDNSQDMVKNGRYHLIGSRNSSAKIDERIVLLMRLCRSKGAKHSEIAEILRISESTVQNAVSGKTWRHI